MGYYTEFDGSIELKNKKAISILKYLIEKKEYPFEWVENEFSIINDELDINNLSWKNYHNEFENILWFVAKLDKKAEGSIEYVGEEREDFGNIKVSNGKVIITKAVVTYDSQEHNPENFVDRVAKIFNQKPDQDNLKIQKKLLEITKDKKLLSKLVLNSI